MPVLGRQRQEDLSEFKASLVYRESSRTARVIIQRNLASENKTIIMVTKKMEFPQKKKGHSLKPVAS